MITRTMKLLKLTHEGHTAYLPADTSYSDVVSEYPGYDSEVVMAKTKMSDKSYLSHATIIEL